MRYIQCYNKLISTANDGQSDGPNNRFNDKKVSREVAVSDDTTKLILVKGWMMEMDVRAAEQSFFIQN
eukprot:scaffold2918_cov142-Skeletonema_menzelii.AAC.1